MTSDGKVRVPVTSDGVTSIPSSVKISQVFQKLKCGTQTDAMVPHKLGSVCFKRGMSSRTRTNLGHNHLYSAHKVL